MKRLNTAVLFLFWAVNCHATAITWNVTDGNWTNSANWSPAQVPGGDDAVSITGTTTVRVDSVLAAVSNLNIDSGANQLYVEPAGYLETTNFVFANNTDFFVNGGVFTQVLGGSAYNPPNSSVTVTNGGSFTIKRWLRVFGFTILVDNSHASFNTLQGRSTGATVTLTNGATFSANLLMTSDNAEDILNVCGGNNTINLGDFEYNTGDGSKAIYNFIMDDDGFSTVNCGNMPLGNSTNATLIIDVGHVVDRPGLPETYILFDSSSLSGTFTYTNWIGCTGDVVYASNQVRIENFKLPARGTVLMIR